MLCLPLDSTVWATRQAELRRIHRIPMNFMRRARLFAELVEAVRVQHGVSRDEALDAVHQCISWIDEEYSDGRAA